MLQKTKTISNLVRLEGEDDLYTLIENCETNHTANVLRYALGKATGNNME